MRRLSWQAAMGGAFLVLSVFFYVLHYLIFRDPHHIFIFLVEDIAFVFVEVLLVTLIIHRVLEAREKKARLEKLNMVIGAFFSEAGTGLLDILSRLDPEAEHLQKELAAEGAASGQALSRARLRFEKHRFSLEADRVDWAALKGYLAEKKDFFLRLLENPNLLEHEAFTEMLWAVFHLAEELYARERLDGLPDTDYRHLVGDIKRVYGQLARQWIAYMDHLKGSYPFLFSLALRTSPFNRSASPIVRE